MCDNRAFLMNLPSEIILDILSRLPIRTIVSCKFVCRQLLELISSAVFAELHLPRSSPGLIIHCHQFWTGQDLCKIFEFEDEVEVQHHNLHYKQLMEFDLRSIITTRNAYIRMEGGSVNGLLCLLDRTGHFDAFYICNPVTQEYIALPRTEKAVKHPDVVIYGFGVSSSSGEYKLVRISQGPVTSSGKSSRNIPDLECMIYTLGTGSWRSITLGATFELDPCSGHACLSGSLHWLVGDAQGSSFIACFNLETELINSFPTNPFSIPFPGCGKLVILGDCLCVCDCTPDDEIVIWVMKDYGVGGSWTKECVIRRTIWYLEWMITDGVWPLKAFKDGDILFFWQVGFLFYYSSKDETAPRVDLFEGQGTETGEFLPMLHTPSFVSLKRFEKENVASFGF